MKSKIYIEYVAGKVMKVKHEKVKGCPNKVLDKIVHSDAIDLDTRQILWIDLLDEDGNSMAKWDSGVKYD